MKVFGLVSSGQVVSIPLRGFFSFQLIHERDNGAGKNEYQSPCGDSFHFNQNENHPDSTTIIVSIPLRGFFSFQRNSLLRRWLLQSTYQSPCGDSFHFNEGHYTFGAVIYSVSIPLRGFFSFQLRGVLVYANTRHLYQSPCGDSFHFNFSPDGIVDALTSLYQSPCGDSFHFNFVVCQGFRARRYVSIPLRGFFSFQPKSQKLMSLSMLIRINPLAGILFISTPQRNL